MNARIGTLIALTAAVTVMLTGCPKNWSAEEQKLEASEAWAACHVTDDAGVETAKDDGAECRAAQCIIEGQILVPNSNPPAMVPQHIAIARGICQESGTVCSEAVRKPCKPSEVCEVQDGQAVCRSN